MIPEIHGEEECLPRAGKKLNDQPKGKITGEAAEKLNVIHNPLPISKMIHDRLTWKDRNWVAAPITYGSPAVP